MNEFELVSPSGGGTFSQGWECGYIEHLLGAARGLRTRLILRHTIRTANLEEIDRIAMRHEFTAEYADTEDPAWTFAQFTWPPIEADPRFEDSE
ncbi:hypothetical protein [Nocardia jiangxiensis]|uniref:hypothetical protein n=1 Tax=Nocardia jiangxiensis TaxID=282685 RepID=UPI0002FEC3F0|nr:hypothetical protein [Nocardia jiangxiensis]